jgi:DNA-binding CsgD family transcriptional regulator
VCSVPITTTCYASWLELVGDLLQRAPPEFPHGQVAELLRTSFDAAVCSRNVVDAAWVDSVAGCWPADYLPSTPPSGRPADPSWQPLLRWYAVTRSPAPQTLGRVPSAVAGPRMVAAWTAFARPLGITHQLSVPLLLGDGVEAFVLSRPDQDCSEEDTELAASILPALSALFRQQRVLDDVPAAQYGLGRDVGLTGRELAVLRLLCAGLTAEAMARRLGTSPRTVHKHLEHLYRKLGVRDRLMAVQRARECGLLDGAGKVGRRPGTRDGAVLVRVQR